jgi:hypothetical protein
MTGIRLIVFPVFCCAAIPGCDTQLFSVSATTTVPAVPAARDAFFSRFLIPAPPPSMVPGCSYEICALVGRYDATHHDWAGPLGRSLASRYHRVGAPSEASPGPTNFGGIIETRAPHDPGPGEMEIVAPGVIGFHCGSHQHASQAQLAR